MRVIAGLGSLLFAYLALIPAGLVAATLDPACAGGECETPLAQDILFVVLYGGSCVAVAGCAALLAAYALRPAPRIEHAIRQGLIAAVVTAGLTFLALFALTSPLAAAVTLGIGATTYALIRRGMARDRPRAANLNGA